MNRLSRLSILNPLPNPSPNPQPLIREDINTERQRAAIIKIVGKITKAYTKEQKYDGTSGSFDYKLTIFYNIYSCIDLPNSQRIRVLPSMLKGMALNYFYINRLSNLILEDASISIKNFFEGPEYYRRNLTK